MREGIYQVPDGRRYWIVRAEGGDYFNHFSQYGVVAIGHLEGVSPSVWRARSDFNEMDWPRLYEEVQFQAARNELSSRQGRTRFNQIRKFMEEFSVGDWVVTIGPVSVRIGQVASEAIYDAEPLILRGVGDAEIRMPYALRRRVIWGPSIRKEKLSAPLSRTLRANQTIFNADSLWEHICHAVMPVFSRGDNLYFTIQIDSEERVRSIDLSNLLIFLNEIEVIAKESSALSANPGLFDEIFEDYESTNELSLTTEAEFHSPGEIWGMVTGLISSVPGSIGWGGMFLIGYAMIFGNSKLGFDGLVDIETRRKIWDLFLDRYQLRRIERASARLDLNIPSKDVSNLIKVLPDAANEPVKSKDLK